MNTATVFSKAWDYAFTLSKEDVTLHTVTKAWDSNDDYNESESNSTISARIEVLEADQVDGFGGVLNMGDAVGFFESTDTLAIGSRITHNSIKYDIVRVLKENVQSNTIFQEIWLRRIHVA